MEEWRKVGGGGGEQENCVGVLVFLMSLTFSRKKYSPPTPWP